MKAINTLFFFLCCSSWLTTQADYFGQDVRYEIRVTLDDNIDALFGDVTIFYKNNSPAVLNVLYLHIWPAAYSGSNTVLAKEFFLSGNPQFLRAPEKDLGNIHSLDFIVNNEKVQWKKLKDTVDVCLLRLNKPLNSGDSIVIKTPFRIKIPAAYLSRMGHEGQAYYITQWYPKPAVYDEKGWNYFPYHDQGEFYGEFGTYDVYITLPENYLLAATGVRVDAAGELAWLDARDSITRTLESFPSDEETPPSSPTMKTVHFRQDRVHDFAWFADKRWHVLKDSVTLSPGGKKIVTWSFFNNAEAGYWLKSPQYLREGLQFFSGLVGEYPYEEITAVDVGHAAGNGMEYPMITPIGNYGSELELEQTILHEVGHNWFYGILGNNERCHPLLDEGITTYYEIRYVYSKYAGDSAKQTDTSPFPNYFRVTPSGRVNHRMKKQYRYLGTARLNMDQSPDLCADQFSNENYRSDVYAKTSISFDYLNHYLGDSIFDRCMHIYFETWKFRHPLPRDLREIFERETGKNLSWFFNDLLSTAGKLNYKISRVKYKDDEEIQLTLENTGTVGGPIPLYAMRNGVPVRTIWMEGFSGKKDTLFPCHACDEIRIDSYKRLPELYRSDNQARLKGLFKRTEKTEWSPGLKIEDGSKTQIMYLPVVGWNNYNKFMPGLLIHNISFHEKKTEFRLMPLYGVGANDLAGGGDVNFHIYPYLPRISRITLRSGISRYAYRNDEYTSSSFDYAGTNHFVKWDSGIEIFFRQKNPQDHFRNTLTARAVYEIRDLPYSYHYKESKLNKLFGQLEFKRVNTNPLNRALERITFTVNDEFFGLYGEAKQFFVYDSPRKGFEARVFAGYIKTQSPVLDYRMSLDGRTGERDYLFDEVFIGRTESEGILARQYVTDYAGFHARTSYFRLAEKWMTGANISTTLPGLIPFRIFAGAGTFDGAGMQGKFGRISWEAGVDLPLIKDMFVISFPFAYSNDIKYAIEAQGLKKTDLIRFELHLKELNPFNYIKSFYDK